MVRRQARKTMRPSVFILFLVSVEGAFPGGTGLGEKRYYLRLRGKMQKTILSTFYFLLLLPPQQIDFYVWQAWEAADDVQTRDASSRFVRVPQPDPERSGLAFDDEDRIALHDRRRHNHTSIFKRIEKVRQVRAELLAFNRRIIFVYLSRWKFDRFGRFEQQSRRRRRPCFALLVNSHKRSFQL